MAKDPKYNNTGNRKSWWPIKQFRFNTEKHPVLKPCRGKPSMVPVSWDEKQMLEGLSRILQCDEKAALRIAVYEFLQVPENALGIKYRHETATGVTRNYKASVSLPSTLHKDLDKAAKELGITTKHCLRYALVRLCKGIRDESIKRLTKSPRIGQQKLMEEWKKQGDNANKKGTLKALHEAHEGWDDPDNWTQEQWDRYDENTQAYERRGEYVRSHGLHHLWSNGDDGGGKWMDTHTVDELMARDHKDELRKQGLSERQIKIDSYLAIGLSMEEAKECADLEEEEEKEENLTDEELEAMMLSFMDSLN